MHCQCCDKLLTDYEATRRSVTTGEFIDLCNQCYSTISKDVLTLDRGDLRHESDDVEYIEDDVVLMQLMDIRLDNEDNL